MEKVVIRKIKKGDEKDLLEMFNSLVAEKTMTIATKKLTLKQEKEFVDKVLEGAKNKKQVELVLEINGKILGSAGVRIESDITGHVGNFGILMKKEARGRGLGFRLSKATISEAKKRLKVKIVRLNVSYRNNAAVGLYKKLGFKEAGVIKKGLQFFGRYDDEIIMVNYLA
ncbi:MAG: GNAT family N-acetyltransferase [Candidatus Pacebacteria bacterium]|nr:GNAT family N-acetyltransferase [Candidatus Paceibacterota bacterium]